jgi:hypothetical protein
MTGNIGDSFNTLSLPLAASAARRGAAARTHGVHTFVRPKGCQKW